MGGSDLIFLKNVLMRGMRVKNPPGIHYQITYSIIFDFSQRPANVHTEKIAISTVLLTDLYFYFKTF